jgi:hypothetical protein
MIRGSDGRHDVLAVSSQLGVLMEDVHPAVLIQDHGTSVRVNPLGENDHADGSSRWLRTFRTAKCPHLAGEPRGRLAGVRGEFVQLHGKRLRQCDLQATARWLRPQACSLMVFVLVLLVAVMW